jgi:hypothetical protein
MPPGSRAIAWLLPLLAGVFAMAPVLIAMTVSAPGRGLFIDWFAYAMGTQRLLAGESLYLPIQLAGPYHLPDVTPSGYIYPPPSALLFGPFALPTVGIAAWTVLNVSVFLAGIAAVLRRELGSVRPLPLALALFALSIVIPLPGGQALAPFTSGVGTGNVNVALAGVLALAWATGTRRGWIPVVAGVAGVFKIFPAALALWAARASGWHALGVTAGVAAVLVVVTLPFIGLDEWSRFLAALSNAEPSCNAGRASVACLATPLFGGPAAKVAGVALGGALLALATVSRREYPAFVLLTLGMLAPLADGHPHYLLFLYVLVLIGVARLHGRRRSTLGEVRTTHGLQ